MGDAPPGGPQSPPFQKRRGNGRTLLDDEDIHHDVIGITMVSFDFKKVSDGVTLRVAEGVSSFREGWVSCSNPKATGCWTEDCPGDRSGASYRRGPHLLRIGVE